MAELDIDASTSLPTSTTALEPHVAATPHVVNIATRKSGLALKQTDVVCDLLRSVWPNHEYKVHAHSTAGDRDKVTALHEIGAKSLWTAELEKLLLENEVDMIVHSLKDMPTQLPKGCVLGAIVGREDRRDALLLHPSLPEGTTLSSLPPDSTIGTSSVRRSAQLKRLYPHLRFQSVRGNIDTRVRKLDQSKLEQSKGQGTKAGDAHTVEEDDKGTLQYSGIVLAAAGLLRTGQGHRITRYLSSKNLEETKGPDGVATQRKGILHAVGQGALGIEVRGDDHRVRELLRPINDQRTWLACIAERNLMRTLEGGCSVPIGVETEWVGGQPESTGNTNIGAIAGAAASLGLEGTAPSADWGERLVMRSIVVSLDGLESVEATAERQIRTTDEANQFGWDVAQKLFEQGADKILEKINLNRNIIEQQGGA